MVNKYLYDKAELELHRRLSLWDSYETLMNTRKEKHIPPDFLITSKKTWDDILIKQMDMEPSPLRKPAVKWASERETPEEKVDRIMKQMGYETGG